MAEPVHLFDIESDFPGAAQSWSPNTLKVRTVLNFKGIPYTQSWISYPDIRPLLMSLEVPPNKTGIAYTLPTIVHKASIKSNPHGALTDSLPIVEHLEKTFPGPSIFPSGDASYALVHAVNRIIDDLSPGVRPVILLGICEHLDERGQVYFRKTREQSLGKSLNELRPTDAAGIEKQWKMCEPFAQTLVDMLRGREGKKGVFFEGEKASMADFMLVCQLAFIGHYDKEFFNRFMTLGNGELKALYDACLPWLEGQGEEKEWPILATA